MAMDYRFATSHARRPIDGLLDCVAAIWERIGLEAEEVEERVLDIETRFETIIQPLRETEEEFEIRTRGETDEAIRAAKALAESIGQKFRELPAEKTLREHLIGAQRELARLEETRKRMQVELEKAIEESTALSVFVGEELKLPKTSMIEDVRKELQRLRARKSRQQEELSEMILKISGEAERLGVDPQKYTVPDDVRGMEGIRLANQRLRQLEDITSERVAEAQKARARIRSLTAELGQPLEFRLALEGELTGPDDGMCILSHSKENARFIRDIAKYEGARGRDVLSSARYLDHLKQLEYEYARAAESGKRRRVNGKGNDPRKASADSRSSNSGIEDRGRSDGIRKSGQCASSVDDRRRVRRRVLRGGRGPRNNRDASDRCEIRDARDARDLRDDREREKRDGRDDRDTYDNRDYNVDTRGGRNLREGRSRDTHADSRDGRFREVREGRDFREDRDKDFRGGERDDRDMRNVRDDRDLRESRDGRDARERPDSRYGREEQKWRDPPHPRRQPVASQRVNFQRGGAQEWKAKVVEVPRRVRVRVKVKGRDRGGKLLNRVCDSQRTEAPVGLVKRGASPRRGPIPFRSRRILRSGAVPDDRPRSPRRRPDQSCQARQPRSSPAKLRLRESAAAEDRGLENRGPPKERNEVTDARPPLARRRLSRASALAADDHKDDRDGDTVIANGEEANTGRGSDFEQVPARPGEEDAFDSDDCVIEDPSVSDEGA